MRYFRSLGGVWRTTLEVDQFWYAHAGTEGKWVRARFGTAFGGYGGDAWPQEITRAEALNIMTQHGIEPDELDREASA